MESTIHQGLNLLTFAIGFGGLGLIFGYGWGEEATLQAQAKATEAKEQARVNRFKTIFEEGVKQKKSAPETRAKSNTRR